MHKNSMNINILLRPLTDQDVTPEYVSWLNDPAIRRYLGIRHRTRPFDKEDIIKFLYDCIHNQRFHWGICIDGRHIGNISCSAWNNENRWIDISFILGDKSIHGRGIATLSVGAAMQYLFDIKKFNRIQSHAVIENTQSLRLMEKLCMRRDAVLRQSAYLPDEDRYVDEVIYSALRNEWKPPLPFIHNVQIKPMIWELMEGELCKD